MNTELTKIFNKLAGRINFQRSLLETDIQEFTKAVIEYLDAREAELERLQDGLQSIADGEYADPEWKVQQLLGSTRGP